MADELIFRIGFDLEAGVKEAMKDGDLALGRIEKALAKKPIIVKMRLDQQERLSGQVKSESKKATSALSGLKKEMAELNRQWNTLTASERGGEAGAKLMAQYRALSEEAKGYMTTLNAAVKLEDKLARQREKSADAAQKATQKTREYSDELKNQDGYISRLLKRMAVYAGYSMATNFLTSIREVTAQFELQRISLGAIIQDQQKANQIFAEIKSFALTSPLKILDLTKYTKQVAAYGFETEKLFDTTKMLADISVGLGVDFGRTVLAYSQVFTTGFLRASEARQMTEQGIPIVDKLAKKLTELNGRIYTAAEVMDMMSKRAISFELVEQVFKDMTSAGGEFYNMQVKQSQTLFGMWSKLGDAAAIMYDQIGNTSTVNAGMKTTMGLLESMMRNWKTTARVLDTVSVALAVYVIGLKNATIASNAVTTAEAARLAITNRQIIATPKLIAAIIGQNTATELSTTLTKAHTVAMLNQSTATNVLSRGFWKLTAAMLANPWVAAAAGIALVVTALFHFIGNTETAAERAEKLNNSIASLKNLDDTTKPLIDTYNELINKTERTAEEQKRLSEVTHELAKQYPGAITAIGNFGTEVELAADKLNQLYQTEKQARMDNTRHELEKTKQKITETEEKIARLQAQLQDGTKTVTVGGSITGYTQTITVQMSDEDKGKILKQIDELRYGEDGQSGLFGLQQSAEAARRALGLIPSEAAQAVEKFGAWKKTFTTFQQQVGQTKVRLFDESTINQFGSLEEALKKTAEEYKKNIALVATYDEVLKSTTLTAEERAKIEGERAEADAMATLAKKALDYYNTLPTAFDKSKGSGRTSDPRLQNLKEEISLVQKLYNEYKQLEKQEGASKAAADMRKMAGGTLDMFKERYNIDLPTDAEDLTAALEILYTKMAQLPKKVFPALDKDLKELRWTIEKVNIDNAQKQIESELKRLADRISRTKTAKEFYEKILSQTGDVELATRVSLSIYGSTGEELFEDTVKQIREVFKSGKEDVVIDLEPVFDMTNQRIDYKMLADIYEKYQNDIIDKNRDTAQKIAQEGQKATASNIANWQKELAKAKDFEQQRTDIIRTAAAEREKIIKEVRDPEERERLLNLSREKESQDLSKLNFEEFTKSEDYIKIFENLDNTATSTLKRLRTELQALIDTNKDLSPENMKTLVKAMEDIDEQISGRGFGNDMVQSVNDYITSIKNLKTAKQELAKAEAEYEAQEPRLDADIETAKAEKESADEDVVAAQQELLDIQTQMAALREQEIIDETQLAALQAQEVAASNALTAAKSKQNQAATAVTNAEQAKAKAADKVKKAEQKVSGEQDKQKKATTKFFNDLQQVAATADQLANELGEIKDLLGISEDSAAGLVFDSAISSLQQMSAAINVAASAQAIFNAIAESNPYIAIAAGVLAVGSAIASWISGSKVRKANKEIERQQELLDQLEYTYGRLENAADKLFGADFVANMNQQQKALQAQAAAYQKQYEAELSKGKKADEEKLKEYQEAYRDTLDEIADMQGKFAERMAGTDVASAARDFAQAWLEAYASFGDTVGAIKEKFNDLIKNMIVESVMAKTVQMALQPMFDHMDEMYKSGKSMTDVLNYAFSQAAYTSQAISDGLEVNAHLLESLGFNVRDLYATSDNLTGISRDIATASEKDINGLAAHMSTVEYYASTVPGMASDVAAIRVLLEGGAARTTAQDGAFSPIDYTPMFSVANQHLQSLPRIEEQLGQIYTLLNRVMVTKGGKFGINSFYNS